MPDRRSSRAAAARRGRPPPGREIPPGSDGDPLSRAVRRAGCAPASPRGRLMPRLVVFCQSLRSDWNHGNAHFLRGVFTECQARGIEVAAYEPSDSWSARNLATEQGAVALDAWRESYPGLPTIVYDPAGLDLDRA